MIEMIVLLLLAAFGLFYIFGGVHVYMMAEGRGNTIYDGGNFYLKGHIKLLIK